MIKADPNLPEKELAIRAGLTDYAVKHTLNRLGWHRVKGGPAGASPWHQDQGKNCPFLKVLKSGKPVSVSTKGIRATVN
jgi:hypothetical protein